MIDSHIAVVSDPKSTDPNCNLDFAPLQPLKQIEKPQTKGRGRPSGLKYKKAEKKSEKLLQEVSS